ncbi:SH3 domain-containing protein [Aliigemmobacter aestuarii]|nr:SH3 domain-containing protein [Gemmobacter aestuarii]
MRSQAVRFAAGTSGTTITDTIVGRESVAYMLGAEAGQRMVISLNASNLATYFTVFGPGQAPGGEGLANSEMIGPMVPDLNRFDSVLSTSGEYTVLVYMYRSAARRGERSDFTLDISIVGERSEILHGDFADGLQGGPDFLAVRTATAGGHINLRDAPSTGATVLTVAKDGTVLRNLGCRMNEGRRWCQVATLADPGIEAWAAGDFLIEASGGDGVATQLPDMVPVPEVEDVLVPGTAFNATGMISCVRSADAPMQECNFGVIRESPGSGNGSVTIDWPDGGSRVIYFEAGNPVSFDQSQADQGLSMTVTRTENDMNIVMIGSERFEIPDAVIWGG